MFRRVKWLLAAVLLVGACRQEGTPLETPDAPPDPPDARSIWPDGTPHPASEIWVLSWNIETFPKTPEAPDLLADLLTQINPDIVAVQEIRDVDAFVALDDRLPQYQRVLPQDNPGTQDTIVGLLYQPSVVTVSQIDTLFADDSSAFPRSPLKVHASAGGVDFTMAIVHLKAQTDADSLARRRDACLKLDAWVQSELAAGTERDVMVIGDWNDKLTDAPPDNVFQVFLDAPSIYEFLTMPLAEAGEFTFVPFESLIDHALVTSDMRTDVVNSGSAEIMELDLSVDGYTDTLSDHRPLLVKLVP